MGLFDDLDPVPAPVVPHGTPAGGGLFDDLDPAPKADPLAGYGGHGTAPLPSPEQARARRDQFDQQISSFMEPDPVLDHFRQASSFYNTAPDDFPRGTPPTPPVISSYADPRYVNFQTRLHTALGRTLPSDTIKGLLAQKGYQFDENALAGAEQNTANPLLRAGQNIDIGAGKLGANLVDIAGTLANAGDGVLDPKQANGLQRFAQGARSGLQDIEGTFAGGTTATDRLFQSLPGMALAAGPGMAAGGLAKAAGLGDAGIAAAGGAGFGAAQGIESSPEVYRESIEKGLSKGQAFANTGASVGIQAAGMALGSQVAPLTGLTAFAKPAVQLTLRRALIPTVQQALKNTVVGTAEGGLANGLTTAMDLVRQAITTNPGMTYQDAVNQVAQSVKEGGLAGVALGGVHGAGEVGKQAALNAHLDQRLAKAKATIDPMAETQEMPAIQDHLAGLSTTDLRTTQPDISGLHDADTKDMPGVFEGHAGAEVPMADTRTTDPRIVDRQAEKADTVVDHEPVAGPVSERGDAGLPGADSAQDAVRPVVAPLAERGDGSRSEIPSDVRGDVERNAGPETTGPTAGDLHDTGRENNRGLFDDLDPARPDDHPAAPVDETRPGAVDAVDSGRSDVRSEVRGPDGADGLPGESRQSDGDRSAADARHVEDRPANSRSPVVAGDAAPDSLRRAVDRVNKTVEAAGPIPDKFPVNKAGSGYGPGNPKYEVPVRPDLTFQEFKKRISPADAKLLDQAKGQPAAAAKLKERLGWTDRHNAASRIHENAQRNRDRGLTGEVQDGTRKNIRDAHESLNKPKKETTNEVPREEGRQEARPEEARPEPVRRPEEVRQGQGEVAKPAPETPAPSEKSSVPEVQDPHEYRLPDATRRISPRYGYRDNNFELNFGSDLDRAAYTISGKGKSAAHDKILADVMAKTGMSEADIRAHGADVRAELKQRAADAYVAGRKDQKLQIARIEPKQSALEPGARFSVNDFDKAERLDPSVATEAHQVASDLGEQMGVPIETAQLPSHLGGAFNPVDGSILISHKLPEDQVAHVVSHELTHKAVNELPPNLQRRLADIIKKTIGEDAYNKLVAKAKAKWGDIGERGLIEEALAEAGGDIADRRGISWMQEDRGVWQSVKDWFDKQITKLQAALGSTNAKMRQMAESVINTFGRAGSDAPQNSHNYGYSNSDHFERMPDVQFAIRDLAKTDERFGASAERKFEAIGKFLGSQAQAALGKIGAHIARKMFTPAYFAGKHKDFADVFAAQRRMEEQQVQLIDQAQKATPTFMSLKAADKPAVEDVLFDQRDNQIEYTKTDLQNKGLNPQQIDAVMEARTALKGIADARREQLFRSYDEPVQSPAGLRAAAKGLAKSDPSLAAKKSLLADLVENHDRITSRPGYFPASRYGNYRQVVVEDPANPGGKPLYYARTNSKAELESHMAIIRKQFPGIDSPASPYNAKIRRIPDQASTEGYGFSESDITSLARAAKVDPKILHDFLSGGVSDHLMAKGFNKHLMPSSDVPGYSRDFQRSLSTYALSAAHSISMMQFNHETNPAMTRMAETDGELHNYATRWKDYVLNKQDELSWLRNLTFLRFVGFNPGSAISNLTQLPMVTVPFLHALTGSPADALSVHTSATRSLMAFIGESAGNLAKMSVGSRPDLDMVHMYADHVQATNPALAKALRDARSAGVMTQADVREFTNMAKDDRSRTSDVMRKFANSAGWFFSKSERICRMATFEASHEIAVKRMNDAKFWDRASEMGYHGDKSPAKFAAWSVDESQGIYGKTNKPEMFRGTLAPLYVFRQYGQNMAQLLYKLGKLGVNEARRGNVANAPLGALAAYFIQASVAGGVWNAVPGGKAVQAGVNALWSAAGPKRDVEFELEQALGGKMGEFLNHGALGFLSNSTDIPGLKQAANLIGEFGPAMGERATIGNLVPSAGDAGDLLGPAWGAASGIAGDLGALLKGAKQTATGIPADPWAMAKASANLVGGRSGGGVVDAAKALTSSRGIETNNGKTLIPSNEVRGTDVAGLALGLKTKHIDEAETTNKVSQDIKAGSGEILKDLTTAYVDAMMNKDPKGQTRAMASMSDWNKKALAAGRTSDLIAPDAFRQSVKMEIANRKTGVGGLYGTPKRDVLQVKQAQEPISDYRLPVK